MTDHTAPLQLPPEETRTSGRHPVNVGHLVMGVAFLGLFTVWALVVTDAVAGEDVRWLLPFPWVAAGVAGVLASILPSRRHRFEQRQTGWVTPEHTTEQSPEQTTEPTTEQSTEENR